MTKRFLAACLLSVTLAWSLAGYAHGPSEQAAPPVTQPATALEQAAGDAAAQPQGAEENVMLHPGLPEEWLYSAAALMALIAFWALLVRPRGDAEGRTLNLAHLPGIGVLVRFLNRSPYPLLALKILSVGMLVLVIVAGFFGTPYPEHNLATALVWNIWWPLVVVAVIFFGSAWCAVCPWDTLSS